MVSAVWPVCNCMQTFMDFIKTKSYLYAISQKAFHTLSVIRKGLYLTLPHSSGKLLFMCQETYLACTAFYSYSVVIVYVRNWEKAIHNLNWVLKTKSK